MFKLQMLEKCKDCFLPRRGRHSLTKVLLWFSICFLSALVDRAFETTFSTELDDFPPQPLSSNVQMELEAQHRKKTRSAQQSALSQALDHCPLALFPFLSDVDASNVASALCVPNYLASKRYEIKRELPVRAVLAGLYPCVVRRVLYGGNAASWCDQLGGQRMLLKTPVLPTSVTSLTLKRHPDWLRRVSDLPRSLSHFKHQDLNLYLFRKSLLDAADEWPPALTSLELHPASYLSATDALTSLPPLPSTLLEFNYQADLPPGDLPDSLTTLRTPRLGRPFSQLPRRLTTLEIEVPSDDEAQAQAQAQELAAALPALTDLSIYGYPLPHPMLRTLILPHEYNQPIRAIDFPNLRVLSVGTQFSHPLDDLPSSLTELSLLQERATEYIHPLDCLPASLVNLKLDRPLAHPLNKLPSSLRSLHIAAPIQGLRPLDRLPESLTELWITDPFFDRTLNCLPHNLQVLKLNQGFNRPLNSLPAGLTHLEFPHISAFNWPWKNFPETLKVLILPDNYDRPLNHLPDSVSTLHIPGDTFNQPFYRLPRNLTDLKLGSADHSFFSGGFDRPLPLTRSGAKLKDATGTGSASVEKKHMLNFPIALRSLALGSAFNQRLRLPTSLTWLEFDPWGSFSRPLSLDALPEKLIYLCLPCDYRKSKNLPEAKVRKRCPFVYYDHSSAREDGIDYYGKYRDYDDDSEDDDYADYDF